MSHEGIDKPPTLKKYYVIPIHCAVPSCNSNSFICPWKKFYPLPTNPKLRRTWLWRANIELYVSSNPTTVFCQDHFEGRSTECPSRFECQYFTEFDLPHPAPPLQKTAPFNKISKRKSQYLLLDTKQRRPPTPVLGLRILKPPNLREIKRIKQISYSTLTNEVLSNVYLIKIEHNYAKSNHKEFSRKQVRKTKIDDNFLRLNKNNHNFKQTQRKHNAHTDRGDSIYTFKCDDNGTEYINNKKLQDHNIKGKHFINDEDTDSAESFQTFKCEQCGVEFIHNTDLQIHIQKHLYIEEEMRQHLESHDEIEHDLNDFETQPMQYYENENEPLDIKPEIFQCSKCPSSFINEEDMSKHLQIMHGDLNDFTKHLKKLKDNKQNAQKFIDSSNSLNNEKCVETTREESEQELVNFSGYNYNFAEIETSVEIKRENEDNLEDFSMGIQSFDEHILGFDPMHLGTFFNENYCDTLNVNTNIQLEFNGQQLSPNVKQQCVDYQIIKNSGNTFECSFQGFLAQKDSAQPITTMQLNSNIGHIFCKTCLLSFDSQEKLLNHFHELFNTKARLYADAKRVLDADSVRFKKPNTSNDKQYLSEAELMDHIHIAFNKYYKHKVCLQVIKYASEEDNDATKPFADRTICRCCSKPLPKSTILCRRRDKICARCGRIERNKVRRGKSTTSKLYACAKNVQLKSCKDPEDNCDTASANMQKPTKLPMLNQVLKSVSLIKNEPKTEKVLFEDDDDPTSFEENNLLKPLREEDEKVIVQPYDPTLCKSCLIPLHAERTGNSTVCEKCKTQEASNEKRRKSNERRLSIENMKKPFVLLHRLPEKHSDKKHKQSGSEDSNECHICHIKFSNKLHLREHVVLCHL